MTESNDFKLLSNFCGAYFHEDWMLDASAADEVLDVFLRERHTPEQLRQLVNEIAAFAAIHRDDDALEHALWQQFGCNYSPSVDKISASDWLRKIASRFSAEADRLQAIRAGN
jgi:hypothetical protein